MVVELEPVAVPRVDGPRHILVVDDDDLFRESLQQNLIDAGYDAITFADGRSVLEFLGAANGADLILLDWRMPEMTGIEVLRRLRVCGCHWCAARSEAAPGPAQGQPSASGSPTLHAQPRRH